MRRTIVRFGVSAACSPTECAFLSLKILTGTQPNWSPGFGTQNIRQLPQNQEAKKVAELNARVGQTMMEGME